MITTYNEYLEKPKAISIEQMQDLHRQILEEVGEDWDAKELYEELVQTATRYAEFRGKWLVISRDERMSIDSSRTACHNSMIVKFNMLARYLRMNGHKALWRDTLGYEEDDKYCRKTIGDFACYIVFINSINAR